MLHFKVADFICFFNFEWHMQNKVGNYDIFVLWRDRENSITSFYWVVTLPDARPVN